MFSSYIALAVSPRTVACNTRADVLRNATRISRLIDAAYGFAASEGSPPKLVVVPEWTIQGPLLNFRGGDRQREAELAVELPGEESEILARKARELDLYIAGELYLVRDVDFPDRYFNVGFIIGPTGEVIHRRAKLQVADYEPDTMGTTCPHDVFDDWIRIKGNGDPMEALYPVARTEIGNIGLVICMEGGYPEVARGLALNGAEILIRSTYHDPYVSNGWWDLQNRAHAMFNNAYVIAPNVGAQVFSPDGFEVDLCGGQSMIVDYRGHTMIKRDSAASDSMISANLDLDALRRFRTQNGFGRWLKDLRTEQFAPIYQQAIYPKNQYLREPPTVGWYEREREVLNGCIHRLVERGVLMPPVAAGGEKGQALTESVTTNVGNGGANSLDPSIDPPINSVT